MLPYSHAHTCLLKVMNLNLNGEQTTYHLTVPATKE